MSFSRSRSRSTSPKDYHTYANDVYVRIDLDTFGMAVDSLTRSEFFHIRNNRLTFNEANEFIGSVHRLSLPRKLYDMIQSKSTSSEDEVNISSRDFNSRKAPVPLDSSKDVNSSDDEVPRTSTRGNPCKHVCLTVNNWTQDQYDAIWNYPEWKYIIIGKEGKEPGKTPHLQCYGCFTTKRRYAYLATEWKAHIEALISTPLKASVYCKKEGDWAERGKLPKSKTQIATDMASERRRLIRENPIKAYEDNLLGPGELGKAICDQVLYLACKERENRPVITDMIPNSWNIRMDYIVDVKKRHYWVWSSGPDRGKTTWLKMLNKEYRADFYEYAESFQNINSDCQLIMLDEYTKAHLKATTLNRMCDGTYKYPRKGTSPIVFPNITLLVCGNNHPKAVYPKAFRFIEARFNIICIP